MSTGFAIFARGRLDNASCQLLTSLEYVIWQWRRCIHPWYEQWLKEVVPTLAIFGRTAGFVTEEAPLCLPLAPGNDAYVISLDNVMEEWRPQDTP